ncbi:hypothetical protein GGI25_000571 [Coemansia spiralis]|uniref:Peptidase S1 domain-containing protein n=2 Tax=Coemansia TaxID=4863 RepID=A0A9W8KZB8_9FUNG|nr:trypsin-like cysteine/serine peptidase domain-containing protein [Coemansia spiralis]KAJ2680598.1 hypothetical protein GGI25_000571 [Coemansia spiralis]
MPRVGNVARIVGGRPATANEFQSTVFIEAHNPRLLSSQICTGSLIAPNVVLTAAHCVFSEDGAKYSAAEFKVGFGHITPGITSTFVGHSVSKLIVHPSFNLAKLESDIALLILSENADSLSGKPIKVYTGEYYLDTPLRAAGFGMTKPLDITSQPPQLMTVEIGVGKDDLCIRNTDHFDHKYQICSDGRGGKDTCNGDSGGPLITSVDHESGTALIGLTSYGTSNPSNPLGLCAQPGSPGYYTRIAPYIPWITKSAGLNANDISITNSTVTTATATDDGRDAAKSSGALSKISAHAFAVAFAGIAVSVALF